jgi:hypothetical protein
MPLEVKYILKGFIKVNKSNIIRLIYLLKKYINNNINSNFNNR